MIMPASTIRVLLIEDNLAEARLLQEILQVPKFKQFHLRHVKRLAEALAQLQQNHFDAILLDLTLPDSQGLASLPPLLHQAPSLPIVVLTNTNDDDLAIAAVRQGAEDYLVKRQVNAELLARSLCYAIERKQVSETLRKVNEALAMQVQERTAELMKAKELNQLKSEFVSILSHDFRSPLNSILLSTGLLQNSQDQLTEERRLTHFQLIRSAITNMAHLLDEVSLIGKADSGQLQCQLTPLDLAAFCRQLFDELRLSSDENYEFLFSQQGELPQALWDENFLRHILHNLLSNAIKYSPRGGLVQFDLIAQETTLTIQVQDQGIGVPREDQPRLFEPFYRARNVDNIPGTGLGLAIARKCVEAHGGQISVQSEVGVGTTFVVRLPIWKAV
jgi:signal transduction histidine kinase